MARPPRIVEDGGVYHVLNRRAGKQELFGDDGDYLAFEKVLDEAHRYIPMRVLAYCLMPTHWHLILWPERGRDLSRYLQRVTVTHMRRWHAHRASTGMGPLYQGRFRSFPVQDDVHVLSVARYVERNALRAGLVQHAEQWRWCSLWRREHHIAAPWLVDTEQWPVDVPRNWISLVNRPLTLSECNAIERSISRGLPFGTDSWQSRIASRLGLTSTLREPWRPKKKGT